jgi:hypothetical protein
MYDFGAEAARDEAGKLDDLVRTLRVAFAASPLPQCPLASQGRLSAEQEANWRRLQDSVPAESIAAMDIACLLAYLGVDYTGNSNRVLSACRPSVDIRQGAGHANCVFASGHLARLYDRWHDSTILAALLDAELDRRARSEALLALWDAHWPALLRAASQSELRCRRIAQALRCVGAQFPGHAIVRAYMKNVRCSARSHDPVLRAASLKILRLVQGDRQRFGFRGRLLR